jgi:hypothetical protein
MSYAVDSGGATFDAVIPMELRKLSIAELKSGQIFLCQHGKMYRFEHDMSAFLVRLADGSEPSAETIHQFQMDATVELVPNRFGTSSNSVWTETE